MTPETRATEIMPLSLSDAGAARRDAMLHDLTAAMRRHHRRRRLGRGLGGAALLAITAAVAVTAGIRPGRTPPTPVAEKPSQPPAAPAMIVERVRTDPTIVLRYRAAPAPRVEIIGDDDLLDALAAMDRPAGLLEVNGRTILTTEMR